MPSILTLDRVKVNAYDLPKMTSKQFRKALKSLQMNGQQTAAFLGVSEGAVSLWLAGKRPIPGPVCKLVTLALVQQERQP